MNRVSHWHFNVLFLNAQCTSFSSSSIMFGNLYILISHFFIKVATHMPYLFYFGEFVFLLQSFASSLNICIQNFLQICVSKHILLVRVLSFHSLNMVFHRGRQFKVDKVHTYLFFSFMDYGFFVLYMKIDHETLLYRFLL